MGAEESLKDEHRAERAALALALVAITGALLLHGWSPAAKALRAGGFDVTLLVSDSLTQPVRNEALLLRWDARAGEADLVSLGVGKKYAAALNESPEPEAGDMNDPRSGRQLAKAQGRRLQDASARTAEELRVGLMLPDRAAFFVNVEQSVAPGLSGVEADAGVVGLQPGLRRAVESVEGALNGPRGAWALWSALDHRAHASDLSRYDLAVLALEAKALSARRLRPVQLPTGKKGEPKLEFLSALWTTSPGVSAVEPQVEVLNAGAPAGSAASVTRALREGGVDVVYFGNQPSRLSRTWVLDRSGDRAAVRRVLSLLPGRPRAWTLLAPERLLHASVLLGNES